MNKTLKTILITLSVLTAAGGALAAMYFYFKKELKKVIFVGVIEPDELFTGVDDEE